MKKFLDRDAPKQMLISLSGKHFWVKVHFKVQDRSLPIYK